MDATSRIVETDVPARLDRLPWSGFHWRVVVALGITWILDGVEVTLAGSVAGALRASHVLRFTAADVGLAGSAYVAGAVAGALFFGWLTDRLGRKRLFSVTLLFYLLSGAGTALAWDLPSFLMMRFLTGAAIGGEYAAINSAIQELIPARFRGRTDLAIMGSFWVGAAIGGVGSLLFLNADVIDPEYGWRLAFLIGAVIALPVLYLRRFIPESPRWLMVHGHEAQAEAVIAGIEREIGVAPASATAKLRLRSRRVTSLGEVFRALLRGYPRRTVLCLCLMVSQAFFYNAIFFTYAMMLTDFYGVPAGHVGWYVVPFALGNVLGPLLLGRLFDTLGRRIMLTITYAASGGLLLVTGLLFHAGALDATTQTLAWSATFFFASAAASAANLAVAENFPLETRAMAISLFYAIGTGLGGMVAPVVFGLLIASGSRGHVLLGYVVASALMIAAAWLAWRLAEALERRSLEDVARPLSAVEE